MLLRTVAMTSYSATPRPNIDTNTLVPSLQPTHILPPPPKEPPKSWLWTCHICNRTYSLGVTRRCLSDGHYFCSGKKQRKSRNLPKQYRYCTTWFDYAGWKEWGAWRREMRAHKARGSKSGPTEGYTEESKGIVNISGRTQANDDTTTGCPIQCDFPSQCRWPASPQLNEGVGYPHGLETFAIEATHDNNRTEQQDILFPDLQQLLEENLDPSSTLDEENKYYTTGHNFQVFTEQDYPNPLPPPPAPPTLVRDAVASCDDASLSRYELPPSRPSRHGELTSTLLQSTEHCFDALLRLHTQCDGATLALPHTCDESDGEATEKERGEPGDGSKSPPFTDVVEEETSAELDESGDVIMIRIV